MYGTFKTQIVKLEVKMCEISCKLKAGSQYDAGIESNVNVASKYQYTHAFDRNIE